MDARNAGTYPRRSQAWTRLTALPALAAAIALLLAPPAAYAVAEQAREADSFVDSIGVNVHTSYSDTPYATDFDTVRSKLVELGIRHVRDGLKPNRPDQYRALKELSSVGIGSTLILGEPEIGTEGLDELISVLREEVLGAVEAVEGANEIDMFGDASWLPHLAGYQQHLYSAIKSDPDLATLPVLGPSLVHQRNQEALGDISGALDYGNIHSYPSGQPPEGNLGTHLARGVGNSGTKPVMATETGFHTAVGWQGEHDPVSEQAMATYMPRLFFEYFRQGVARTFSYELLDEGHDGGDREDNFGLLRNDLSEKPAFAALRNTIAILADPGPAFGPTTAEYSASGDTRSLRQLLLQKRDGTFYLVLWRANEVWDPVSGRDVDPAGGPVKLDFTRQVESADAYAPNASDGPVVALPPSKSGHLSVDVGEQALIIRLTLGKRVTAPGRIRLWVSKRSVPAGGRVAVRARLPKQAGGRSLPVKIQRWQREGRRWRTVGRGRTTRKGVFRKSLRLGRPRKGRVSRLRVVAREAKPSRAVRVRVR